MKGYISPYLSPIPVPKAAGSFSEGRKKMMATLFLLPEFSSDFKRRFPFGSRVACALGLVLAVLSQSVVAQNVNTTLQGAGGTANWGDAAT